MVRQQYSSIRETFCGLPTIVYFSVLTMKQENDKTFMVNKNLQKLQRFSTLNIIVYGMYVHAGME